MSLLDTLQFGGGRTAEGPRASWRRLVTGAVIGAALVPAASWAQELAQPKSDGPWMGALGASVGYAPAYSGADRHTARFSPQYVLRWGRWTLSNGSALASRAGEEPESGLTADVFSRGAVNAGLSLRIDQGRDSSSTRELNGVHDVPWQVRARLRAGWTVHPRWELLGGLSTDVSGRGGGGGMEFTVLHQWRPDFLANSHWRISTGVTAEWLDARRRNLVFGITPEDARRSGYAEYSPGAGWSEVRWFANWRRPIDRHWTAYGAMGASHLLSGTAASPLVRRDTNLSISVGLGRRFD